MGVSRAVEALELLVLRPDRSSSLLLFAFAIELCELSVEESELLRLIGGQLPILGKVLHSEHQSSPNKLSF